MTKILSLPTHQVHVSFVRSALRNAVARGFDAGALLQHCNIDPALLEGRHSFIALHSFMLLQEHVMGLLGDEMLGYGGGRPKIGVWKFACRASLTEGSLGQVLIRLFEFCELFTTGPQLRLVLDCDRVAIEIRTHHSEPELERFTCELIFCALYRFCTWLVKTTLPLTEVSFRQIGETAPANYAWLFHGAEVSFEQPRTALCFDRKWLDTPVQRDSQSLEEWLKLGFNGLYDAEFDELPWSTRLRKMLARHLPHLPEFYEIATQLSINPHTLRRRLAAEGFSYQSIKDEVRRHAAECYLSESTLPIEEVAFRAGFSEASCFIRAFKRWTGMTPHCYSKSYRAFPMNYPAKVC